MTHTPVVVVVVVVSTRRAGAISSSPSPCYLVVPRVEVAVEVAVEGMIMVIDGSMGGLGLN